MLRKSHVGVFGAEILLMQQDLWDSVLSDTIVKTTETSLTKLGVLNRIAARAVVP